ncbi:glycosyltransferase family 39 protein [Clostridium magnum]|uniref:Undecaprenyl phosphate-alpha-4-amino-4-deoxy-L-arabinose arabinosyl transferase n=1 Tax=Clostridium magnum DSM 2767 TaxID=1121326 RepID=A0A162R9A5_9CLOT|nr:glycosyltransferase family 39 protein [Clostridium magnum]KZL89583.1 undecaprenyl phosphate-alpha-4-amino-4-deoxy-L-arabinose arabinosyl transferase [Clostridium magnum DSM 2767]SHH73202.1 Dolichyl-phosphate-mannose-protein mannosyltransferase [Clostridium magnum DSM 2767]
MKKVKFTKETFGLVMILILSSVLNLTNLGIEGYANQYYAAGVKSMTMSLKNFFFVSFDPASFVTIDKPPLGFWIQTISAKIFGFSGWSIILPQAIAGVISVWVIYRVVKRSFGSAAGLISALCLAVTPVFVAVSRNNTCDNLLVLTLLLACWALSIAAEKGKLKYLLISLALVGVGFNIKMLQAYMVVPALYITYLLANSVSIKKRIVHLIAGTAVLIVVSFSWAVAVDLTPAANRPYVGSSTSNSVLQLILEHNGLERLGIGGTSNSAPGGNPGANMQRQNDRDQIKSENQTDAASSVAKGQSIQGNNTENSSANAGGQGMPGGAPNGNGPGQGMPPEAPPNGDGQRQGSPGSNGGGQGGTFGGKEKSSITRLFSNNSLSDQIIWLFPLAIFGFIAAGIKEKLGKSFDNKRKQLLVLWFMWMLPEFIYFSFTTGLFHPYYLTMLAAPIAALTGIGIVSMWELYKEGGWKSWILPAALIADGLVQVLLISYYYSTSNVAKIIIIITSVLCFASSLILIIVNLIKNKNTKLKKIALSTALIGLLVAPTVWSGTTMFYGMSGSFPSAGLSLMSNKQMGGAGMNSGNNSNSKLIEFLQSHKTNEKYLLVTSSTNGYASDIIIKTGEAVMTWGFFGNDKAITLDQFKELVNKGEVRYVMVGGQGGSNDIMNWVKANGKVVSESEWKDSNQSNNKVSNIKETNNQDGNSTDKSSRGFGGGNSEQLYDLKGISTTSTK